MDNLKNNNRKQIQQHFFQLAKCLLCKNIVISLRDGFLGPGQTPARMTFSREYLFRRRISLITINTGHIELSEPLCGCTSSTFIVNVRSLVSIHFYRKPRQQYHTSLMKDFEILGQMSATKSTPIVMQYQNGKK